MSITQVTEPTGSPAAVAPVALVFKLNNGIVTRSFEGLSDEQVWQRPQGCNPMAWLLGHVTHSRSNLIRTLGVDWNSGLGPEFKRGSAVGEPSAYPSRQAIEAAWTATHSRMREAFAGLTDAKLAEIVTGPPLPGVKTIADLIGFVAFHEAYHVGQISYIRRLLGGSAVAG